MKLEIKTSIAAINVFSQYEPIGIFAPHQRAIYIDDVLVPPGLAKIILLGLDTAMEHYCDEVEAVMRSEGHKI